MVALRPMAAGLPVAARLPAAAWLPLAAWLPTAARLPVAAQLPLAAGLPLGVGLLLAGRLPMAAWLPVPAWLPVTLDSSSGLLWTRNSSLWRSGASVCSLSQILETGTVDRRYYLSAKACRGILRRAEKRGKLETLPEALRLALEAVAGSEPTSRQRGGCKESASQGQCQP